MNSDLHNRLLETKLLGQWTCAHERETCEYVFLPHNEYTCTITKRGEAPFKVRGYWDVVGEQLRIGASALANEPAHIVKVDLNCFAAEFAPGCLKRFERCHHA
jgi:hypothetical protein